MTIFIKTRAARRKILRILPRQFLEDSCGLGQPWHFSIKDLVEACIPRWDEDAMREALEDILRRAKG